MKKAAEGGGAGQSRGTNGGADSQEEETARTAIERSRGGRSEEGRQADKKNDFDTERRRRATIQSRRDGGREGAINQLDEMVYPPPEGRTDGGRDGRTDSDAVH